MGLTTRHDTLTSRERLSRALSRQQPDRVPIWMLYPREQYGSYVDVWNLPSYRRVMPAIRDLTDWLDRRNIPDAPFHTAAAKVDREVVQRGSYMISRQVLHTPYGDLTSEDVKASADAGSTRTEHTVKDISDLDKILAIPYEPVEPDLAAYHAASSKLGDAGLMMVNIGMPIGVAYGLVHPQTFAEWSLTEREALARFTREMLSREYAFLKKALEKGAGPVFFTVGTEFVAPPMCSPAAFDALVAPFDAPLFELIHSYGGKVIVHHHGNTHAILERIANLGADGIQPIEEPPVGDCTMADAKRRIGGRVCLVGSVQYDDLARLGGDELEALVARQIRDAASGGGMILAPTAGPYASTISDRQQDNILRFIEAGHRWGRYPLGG